MISIIHKYWIKVNGLFDITKDTVSNGQDYMYITYAHGTNINLFIYNMISQFAMIDANVADLRSTCILPGSIRIIRQYIITWAQCNFMSSTWRYSYELYWLFSNCIQYYYVLVYCRWLQLDLNDIHDVIDSYNCGCCYIILKLTLALCSRDALEASFPLTGVNSIWKSGLSWCSTIAG